MTTSGDRGEGHDHLENGQEDEWIPPPIPFSFKLTLVVMTLYVGYRLVQVAMCIPSFFRGTDCPFL